jgi:hypothetical protein
MELECVSIVAALIGLLVFGVGRTLAAPILHPVYRQELEHQEIERLKALVGPVMGLSEEDLVALVPDRTGFYYLKCANCDEGTHESQLAWSIDLPAHMTCKFCATVFPNEKYPEDRVLKVKNPLGVEVDYPYFEDETGYRFFFTARAWYCARFYLAAQARNLGDLYQATGDRIYSRRTALILTSFAAHYPGYLVCFDEVHVPKAFHAEPPFPRRGGKWGAWRYNEIPTDLVYAYDAIYSSGDLERFSKEKGSDVQRAIEEDFFRGGVRQDDFHGPLFTNASPGTYEGYAVLGRVLGDAELVHVSVRRVREFLNQWFFVDGFWRECSMGYHRYTLTNLQRALDALDGYSDPVGFVDPVDGTRLDRLSIEKEFPIIQRSRDILQDCRYPDGRPITVHDSWSKFDDRPVPERSRSVLYAGAGHAWLGTGEGTDQIQAHLHFSDNQFAHTHADMLNFVLYARGEEFLPDVGYTHSRYRQWATSTLCHNTVVIDEQEQFKGTHAEPGDGQLTAFESSFEMIQWIEAVGNRAYPELAQTYRRNLLLVRLEDGNVYVVDLFDVIGGEQHDYVLHGSADRSSGFSSNIPMEKYGEHMLRGIQVRGPKHARDSGDASGRNPNYAFIREVSCGTVSADAVLAMDFPDNSKGLKTHLVEQGNAELYLGKAPSIRKAEENDGKLDEFLFPVAIVRRAGDKPLSSEFVAVHDPFDASPNILKVSRVSSAESGSGVVLKVEHKWGVDWILSHRGKTPGLATADGALDGRLGFVRERDGRPVAMSLLDGTALSWKGHEVSGPGTYSGVVKSTLRKGSGDGRDALIVEGELEKGESLKGGTVIAQFGDGSTLGFKIDKVEPYNEGSCIVVAGDPGFEVYDKGARHTSCPGYDIPGEMSFTIRTSALVEFQKDGHVLSAVGNMAYKGLGETA